MAVINFEKVLMGSDLILKEIAPFEAYTREVTPTTVVAGTTVQLGAIVFRAKSALASVPFTVLTDVADLVDTNDFGVYYADELGQIMPVDTSTAGVRNILSIVRGSIILKDLAIYNALEALDVTLTDDDKAQIVKLLAGQGVVVEKVLG